MKPITRLLQATAMAAALAAAFCASAQTEPAAPAAQTDERAVQRSATLAERYEVSSLVAARFAAPAATEMEIAAKAGYRFMHAPEYLYFERADTGSVGFERPQYGTAEGGIAAADLAADRDALLARIEAALARTGLNSEGRVFDRFDDEYAGAAVPASLAPGADPRALSQHVARTAVYRRELSGLPVFGSELMVGLMPDGSVGRFRLHWPAIDRGVVAEALALRQAVQGRRWAQPESLNAEGLRVLDTSVGIVHSGIADPGWRAAAVVRVLYRKQSQDSDLPLSSTGYKYFDAQGNEVRISSFPRLAGTRAGLKR